MKKLVALVLVLMLLLSVSAIAEETPANNEITAQTDSTTTTSVVLDLGVQPTTYTVVIPSVVNLDPTTGEGSCAVTLKSGFVLTDVTKLRVKIQTGNGFWFEKNTSGTIINSYMTLKNTENSSVVYVDVKAILKGYNDYTIIKNDELFYVTNQQSNDNDISIPFKFSVSGTLPPYGKYTGSLTFRVVTE